MKMQKIRINSRKKGTPQITSENSSQTIHLNSRERKKNILTIKSEKQLSNCTFNKTLNEKKISSKEKEKLKINNNINNKWELIEYQQEYMEKLFIKFNLKTLDDWLLISFNKLNNLNKNNNLNNINENNNLEEISINNINNDINYHLNNLNNFLSIYYKKEIKKLLKKIYPNFSWDFSFNKKKKINFQSIEEQRKRMEEIFKKLNLKSIDDWKNISKRIFEKNGGGSLLYCSHYKGDFFKLLTTIYPNFFSISNENSFQIPIFPSKKYFKLIKKQKEYMDNLFIILNLNLIEDWLNISKEKFIQNGGKNLLNYYYKGDFSLLLQTIYPNYPFDFKLLKFKSQNYFKSIENQKEFLEYLFIKFKLNSLEDWVNISQKNLKLKKNLIEKGGMKILLSYYKNDMKKILSTIYPNYPWTFYTPINFNSNSNLNSNFNLNNNNNNNKNNFISEEKKFLSSNSTAKIEILKISNAKEYFKSIENQRQFMDSLFIKFNLNSLDEWCLKINQEKLIRNNKNNNLNNNLNNENYLNNNNLINNYNGKYLFKLYNKKMKKILSTIYPNFAWDFNIKKLENKNILQNKIIKKNQKKMNKIIKPKKEKFSFKLIENQRKKMTQIFNLIKLKSIDDWLNITKKNFEKNGGKTLLNVYYKGDFFKLLTTIYPNYSFNFSLFQNEKKNLILYSKKHFNFIDNQRKFIDNLFHYLNLNLIDDWLNIPRKLIIKNGGKFLIRYYKGDFSLLLLTIYPNYPFNFKLLKFKSIYFKSIENQKEFLDDLFIKLNLISLDNWIKISKNKIIDEGGKSLLKRYNNNMKFLLTSIYPNYPWENSAFNLHYNLAPLIKEWIKKYQINQKKDWFRLAVDISFKFELFETLSLFYPSEKWKKSNFLIRNKKTTQRLLFSFTQMIYPSLLIFENYFHPKLIISNNNYELDIFIPALQLALEYQGQHHYDDLPAGFGGIELLQSRDEEKEKLAKDLNIKIIYIPYWWDQSLSSLLSSLQSSQ